MKVLAGGWCHDSRCSRVRTQYESRPEGTTEEAHSQRFSDLARFQSQPMQGLPDGPSAANHKGPKQKHKRNKYRHKGYPQHWRALARHELHIVPIRGNGNGSQHTDHGISHKFHHSTQPGASGIPNQVKHHVLSLWHHQRGSPKDDPHVKDHSSLICPRNGSVEAKPCSDLDQEDAKQRQKKQTANTVEHTLRPP